MSGRRRDPSEAGRAPADKTRSSRTGLSWDRDGHDWPNHEASRFVEAAGLTWHVQVVGQGPVLLLVHGTGASTHSWRDLIPSLAQRFTVVAPDLPGHAFTGTPPGRGLSLPGMAKALSRLLAVLEVEPRLAVGHSAGAAILAQMCLDHQIAPAGLISLNGALRPIGGIAGQVFSPLAKLLSRTSTLPRLLAWWAGDDETVQRMLIQTGSKIDRDGIGYYARLARDPDHMAGALSMMANWNLEAFERRLPTLPVPIALVVGSRDGSIPADNAFLLRDRIPGAKGESLKGLGHLAHEERPTDMVGLIERYAREWRVISD